MSAFRRVGARHAVPHVAISREERDLAHAGYEAFRYFDGNSPLLRDLARTRAKSTAPH